MLFLSILRKLKFWFFTFQKQYKNKNKKAFRKYRKNYLKKNK